MPEPSSASSTSSPNLHVNSFPNSSSPKRDSKGRSINGEHALFSPFTVGPWDHRPRAQAKGLLRDSRSDGSGSPHRQMTAGSDLGPTALSSVMRSLVLPGTPQVASQALKGGLERRAYLSPPQRENYHAQLNRGKEHSQTRQVQPEEQPKPKRAKMDVDRRAEVSMVRSLGACLRCKLMKTPCSSSRPCTECQKNGLFRFRHLPCISGNLKNLLPALFGPATGSLSISKEYAAFEKKLSPYGYGIMHNLPYTLDNEVLSLTLPCLNPQSLAIDTAMVSDLLDKLDDVFIRHRSSASLRDLRSGVLSICYIMIISRAFVESRAPHERTQQSQAEGPIQSEVSAVDCLLTVAATAMSEDDLFDIVRQCSLPPSRSESGTLPSFMLNQQHVAD